MKKQTTQTNPTKIENLLYWINEYELEDAILTIMAEKEIDDVIRFLRQNFEYDEAEMIYEYYSL